MLLDLDLNFSKPTRKYYPGELIHCEILINSSFAFRCRAIKVRFICPFDSRQIEYFRLYRNAKYYSTGTEARNFKLKKGINKFKVAIEVPHLSHNVFLKYNNTIRCGIKVKVDCKWLPDRMLKDWFVVEPAPIVDDMVIKTTNSLSKLQSAAGRFLDKIF